MLSYVAFLVPAANTRDIVLLTLVLPVSPRGVTDLHASREVILLRNIAQTELKHVILHKDEFPKVDLTAAVFFC